MNKSKSMKIVCSVLLTATVIVMLAPALYTLFISFIDYRVVMGTFGSPWVGFKNFTQAITPQTFKVVLNTALIGVISLIAGGVYVFIGSSAINGINNKPVKGLLTAVFCIPAVVPVSLMTSLLPVTLLHKPSLFLQVIVGSIECLHLAGICTAAALFGKGSTKCTLLFVAVKLMLIFTLDREVMLGISNPLIYEATDVLTTYTYRAGIQNAAYSYGAALHVLKSLLQLVPAAGGAALLCWLLKAERDTDNIQAASSLPSVAAVIPLAIAVMAFVECAYALPSGAAFGTVIPYYMNGFLIALGSALAITAITLVISILVRESGFFGTAAITLAVVFGGSIVGEYMLLRTAGAVNTVLGIILMNLNVVPVAVLIVALAADLKKDALAVGAMCFVLSFSWAWGSWGNVGVLINDRSIFPASLLFREVVMMGGMGVEKGFSLSALVFILLPVLLMVIGAVAASLLKSSDNKQEEIIK